MKVLVINNNDSDRHFIVLALENLFSEADIIECSCPKKAIPLFQSDPFYELIIAGPSALSFYHHLKEQEYATPVLFYTSQNQELENLKEQDQSLLLIKKQEGLENFQGQLSSIDFIKNHHSFLKEIKAYQKVRIFYFWRFNKTLCDVFLKLSEKKFVKVINAHDSYAPEQIYKYAGHHQKYLYIKKEDFESFANVLGQSDFLEFDETLDSTDKISRTNLILKEMALSSGISESLIKEANKNIELLKTEVKKNKKLFKLLSQSTNRMDYGHDHSTLLCFFCVALAEVLGWTTRRSQEKLCLAALFHDITLDNQELSRLNAYDRDKIESLSEEEKNSLFNHSYESAKLAEELSSTYPQVDQIIQLHHETPDGKGFPKGVNFTKIPPLPSLFIVAHDIVDQLYHYDFDPIHQEEIIKSIDERYTQGHFLKIAQGLKEVIC